MFENQENIQEIQPNKIINIVDSYAFNFACVCGLVYVFYVLFCILGYVLAFTFLFLFWFFRIDALSSFCKILFSAYPFVYLFFENIVCVNFIVFLFTIFIPRKIVIDINKKSIFSIIYRIFKFLFVVCFFLISVVVLLIKF